MEYTSKDGVELETKYEHSDVIAFEAQQKEEKTISKLQQSLAGYFEAIGSRMISEADEMMIRQESNSSCRNADVLKVWLFNHASNPYPTLEDVTQLSSECDMSKHQIRNWFSNIRKRYWLPLREGREPANPLGHIIKVLSGPSPMEAQIISENQNEIDFEFET